MWSNTWQAGKGIADLETMQNYSRRAGEISSYVLGDVLHDIEDEATRNQVVSAVLKENYQNVIANTKAVQKSVNESAGVGLNPILADYDAGIADEISNSISQYEDVEAGISAVANDIVVQSQKYADSSMRKNAEFQSNSGMEVLVTREYDDVGVHTTDKGGGEVCQWCLSRCGTDVSYDEAYQRGMFERHPGCGCVITYKSKKGIFRQGRGDWGTNNWHTVREAKERERRIDFSNEKEDIIRFPKSVGSKWRNYDVKDFESGNIYHFIEGSSIRNPTTFAGYGTKFPLRKEVKKGLSAQYPNTNPEKWEHRKGSGHLNVSGTDKLAEVHWFQQPGIKCGFKVKKMVRIII